MSIDRMTKGLCIRCRKIVDIQNGTIVKTPRGDDLLRGECNCGNPVIAFVPQSTSNSVTNVSSSNSSTNTNSTSNSTTNTHSS